MRKLLLLTVLSYGHHFIYSQNEIGLITSQRIFNGVYSPSLGFYVDFDKFSIDLNIGAHQYIKEYFNFNTGVGIFFPLFNKIAIYTSANFWYENNMYPATEEFARNIEFSPPCNHKLNYFFPIVLGYELEKNKWSFFPFVGAINFGLLGKTTCYVENKNVTRLSYGVNFKYQLKTL